jgi:hypothetical protein
VCPDSLYILVLLITTFCKNAQFIMLKELLQHGVQIFVLAETHGVIQDKVYECLHIVENKTTEVLYNTLDIYIISCEQSLWK